MAIGQRVEKPRRLRWTLREYYRMADLGLFRRRRVELIEGEIIRMPALKGPHAMSLGLTERALDIAFGPGHWVRVQIPLHFGKRSAPEPDLAVVPGTPRDYPDHPTTALLVVEISDTTLYYDRRRKASLYARAGIADYWIVNLKAGRLEVRRRPVPDPQQRYGFGYGDLTVLAPDDEVSPLAAPQPGIRVKELLP